MAQTEFLKDQTWETGFGWEWERWRGKEHFMHSNMLRSSPVSACWQCFPRERRISKMKGFTYLLFWGLPILPLVGSAFKKGDRFTKLLNSPQKPLSCCCLRYDRCTFHDPNPWKFLFGCPSSQSLHPQLVLPYLAHISRSLSHKYPALPTLLFLDPFIQVRMIKSELLAGLG